MGCRFLGLRALDSEFQFWALRLWVSGSGFGVWGFGFRVPVLGFRALGYGFRLWGLGLWVSGVGFEVGGFGCQVPALGLGVWGLGPSRWRRSSKCNPVLGGQESIQVAKSVLQ